MNDSTEDPPVCSGSGLLGGTLRPRSITKPGAPNTYVAIEEGRKSIPMNMTEGRVLAPELHKK